jgi:gas vesicle protein
MRKFREASAELNKGLKEMADEVKEAGQEVGADVDKTVKPQTGLTDDLKEISRELQGAVKETKDSARSATRPARSSTTRSARTASKGASDKPKQAGAATEPEKKETSGDQTAKEDG